MIDRTHGRALGPGKLHRVQRGAGEPRWELSWTDARGNRRSRVLSSDRRVAERLRNDIISKRDLDRAGLGQVEGQSRPLIEICDAYVADLRTHASAVHVTNTQAALKRVLGLVDARRVCDLVVHDVLRVRAELLVEGLSRRTANLQVDRLSAALAWAVKAKLIAANPIAGITRLPETEAYQKRVRRALTDDEIARVIAAAVEDDRRCDALLDRGGMSELLDGTPTASASRHIPQAPLFRFLLEAGCRYGETRAMTWGDVDLDDCVVTLKARTTKARRSRCIPIRHEFASELRRLRELHTRVLGRAPGAAGCVFLTPEGKPWCEASNNLGRIFHRILELAQIPRVDAEGRKVDLHALRGSCASALARRGISIAITQKLLGHSSPILTAKHYVRLDVEDLREAIETTPPLSGPRAPRLVRDDAREETA